MDYNSLTVWQKLLLTMHAENLSVNVSRDADDLVFNCDIGTSPKSISAALSYLKNNKRYVFNDVDAEWHLTQAGRDYAQALKQMLEDYEHDHAVEDDGISQENSAVSYFINEAAKWAAVAAKRANTAVSPIGNASHEENASLKAEIAEQKRDLDAATSIIKNLHARISELSKQLDKKTKQAQQLEDALSKIENSLGQMAVWTHSLKNGGN